MAETARVNGLIGSLGVKAPVRAATTGNVTLSGEQTVDGVALVSGDRVLVWQQTDSTENGVYNVETGTWTRAPDFDGARDTLKGTRIYPAEGVSNAGVAFVLDTPSVSFGSSVISFVADLLGRFLQIGAGAISRTVLSKLRDDFSVKDFGAVGDGVTDDTAAFQAAIDAAYASNNEIARVPAGRYVITDTLGMHPGTKIQGDNLDAGGVFGATSIPNALADAKGSVIMFRPTVEASLFEPVLPLGGSTAWSGIGISGLSIWGNTSLDTFHKAEYGDVSPVVTLSKYAIDFQSVQGSAVDRVSITGFQVGVREGRGSQSNTYSRLYIGRCSESAIEYSELTVIQEATDSVWRDCTFWIHKHIVQCPDTGLSASSGDNLQIRFHECVFKDVAGDAFILSPRSREWGFFDCMGEGLGRDTADVTRSVFHVGVGSGTPYHLPSLIIVGGQYAGDSSAASTFIRAEKTEGISVIAASAKRFGIGISATAATRANSIYLANAIFQTVPTLFSGTTGKIIGQYRTADTESASDTVVLRAGNIAYDGEISIVPSVGSNVKVGDSGTTGHFVPGVNGVMNLGGTSVRWKYLYGENLTTDVDYLLWGKATYTSLSTDGAWLHKTGWVGASTTSGPAGYFNRNGTDGNLLTFVKAGTTVGSISVTASATAYNTSSDYRLKDNVLPLNGSGAFIDALEPVIWTWKIDGSKGAGFLAHILQKVSPSSVTGEKDAMRDEEYVVTPEVPATFDAAGMELTPAVPAVMGIRSVPDYQAVEYGSAEVIANMVAELKDLRARLAAAGVP